MIVSDIKSRLRRFVHCEDGIMNALDAALITPLILGCIIGVFSVTDAYRTIHQNVVSTYAIGDIVSRQADDVTPEFLDGLNTLHSMLTRAPERTSLRVSVIHYNYNRDKYEVEWSHADSTDHVPRTTGTLSDITGKIPTLANGESIILVETWMRFTPISNFLIGSFEFSEATVTRPRYSSTISWTGEMQDSQAQSNNDDDEDYDHLGQPQCNQWWCW